MSDQKKMSVAEILAAARKTDSKGDGAAPKESAESETPPAAPEPRAEANAEQVAAATRPAEEAAPAPAAAKKPLVAGVRPNVKDILAMARAGKPGAATATTTDTPKAPAAAKPAAAKPAAAKPAAKPEAKPAATVAKDTASILAAARKSVKPGPMTKAEAAAIQAKAASPAGPSKVKEKAVVPPLPTKTGLRQTIAGTGCGRRKSARFLSCFVRLGAGDWIHRVFRHDGFVDPRLRAVHVPEHSDRAPQPVQSWLQGKLRARPGRDEIRQLCSACGSSTANTTANSKSTRCEPSAPIWVARRTGWKRNKNSNAPATAAGFTRMASTSKALPRGRWSDTPSASATTGNWKSTRAEYFRKNWVNGPIPIVLWRCEWQVLAQVTKCLQIRPRNRADSQNNWKQRFNGNRLTAHQRHQTRRHLDHQNSPPHHVARRNDSRIVKSGKASSGTRCRWIGAIASW